MMGNLIVRQIQFLLEKINLRQNSYRQVEGVRRSKRMSVTSSLMSLSLPSLSCLSLSPVCLSPSSLPLSLNRSPLCLSLLSLSSLTLPLSYLSSRSLTHPLIPLVSLRVPCSISPSPVSPCPYPLSPLIGRHLSLHPVSLACHSSLSVPNLYSPYTTITV